MMVADDRKGWVNVSEVPLPKPIGRILIDVRCSEGHFHVLRRVYHGSIAMWKCTPETLVGHEDSDFATATHWAPHMKPYLAARAA